MSKVPIALQLYSVREDCEKDLAGVLKEVARTGYTGVEFAGFHGHNAKDVRAMLDDSGLKCAGSHTPFDRLLEEEFEKTVGFNKTLGNPFLIVPSLPDQYCDTLEAWKKTANLFNGLAERAKAVNMRVGYHNHSAEFQSLEGQYPWDIFFSDLREDVIMQLDTSNALDAGVDISPFVERYPSRAVTVHLKEWTDDPKGAVIGEGKVPWETIFRLCESVGGTEWYIVEQEVYPHPPMECAEKCLQNLRAMGK